MDNGASSYRRFLDGDDTGLAEIVREYSDGLTLYLCGIVNDFSTAEELMEETLFKLITKKPKYRSAYSFKTWLYTIGRHVAIDYLRRQKRADTGHHPHQKDGRGSHRILQGRRHPGAVYALRRANHRTHGDHPGSAFGRVRRAGGHQPAA